MDKTELKTAMAVLVKVLETQQGIIPPKPNHVTAGAEAAKFCTDFMEAYASWAKKQTK